MKHMGSDTICLHTSNGKKFSNLSRHSASSVHFKWGLVLYTDDAHQSYKNREIIKIKIGISE